MSQPDSLPSAPAPQRVRIGYDIRERGETRRRELPFVIAVLADLSGAGDRPGAADTAPHLLDVAAGGIDPLLAQLAPRLTFTADNQVEADGTLLPVEIGLRGASGFSPAAIEPQVPLLSRLRALQRQLPAGDATRSALDNILTATAGPDDAIAAARDGLQRWLRGERGGEVAARMHGWIDALVAAQCEAILKAPAFAALRQAWRGLDYLLRQMPLGAALAVRVLDIGKAGLLRLLRQAPIGPESVLYRRLHDDLYDSVDGAPVALLVGDYAFTNRPDDLAALQQLGQLAAALHAPFVAAAAPQLFGLAGFDDAPALRGAAAGMDGPAFAKWKSLRERPEARLLALALPAVAVRSGLGDGPINPAYAVAATLARMYGVDGWFGPLADRPELAAIAEASSAGAELLLDAESEARLAQAGFVTLARRASTEPLRLATLTGIARIREYSRAETSADARLLGELPLALAAGRMVQALKLVARELDRRGLSRQDYVNALADWLDGYVLPDGAEPSPAEIARPLRDARLELTADPGRAGRFRATLTVHPWLHFERLSAPLRLALEL